MKNTEFRIYRIAEFGDFIVYIRGAWARRERLPMYLVSRQSDGRDLKEFRRKKSALLWAQAQNVTRDVMSFAMSQPGEPLVYSRCIIFPKVPLTEAEKLHGATLAEEKGA